MKKLILLCSVLFFATFASQAQEKSPQPLNNKSPELVSFEDKETSKFGFKDKDGNIVLEAIYEVSYEFSHGLAAVVMEKEGWVYINTKGEIEMRPFIFDNGPDYFEEGLARIQKDGKIGFVNEKMEIVIKPEFDFAYPFEDGISQVCRGCSQQPYAHIQERWGCIDKSGKIIVPLVEDDPDSALERAKK